VLVIFSGLDMKFDTSEKELLTLFKPYQAALLEHIWELNSEGRVSVTSRQAYEFQRDHPDSKSRASVIFFLNEIVEEGVLMCEEESERGGYHRVHYPKMNREQFAQHVVETITDKLNEVFP
jgi:predicted transcriptional regulator